MNNYLFVIIGFVILVGLGVLFLSFRKKAPFPPPGSSSRGFDKDPLKEPPQARPSEKPSPPDMGLWFQRVDQARYFPLREGLAPASFDRFDERGKKLVEEKLTGLLPLPPSTLKLTNLLRSPQSNAKEISAIASKDPILSARILRAVNSAYFGVTREVTSVGQAIVLLGYNQVKALLFDDIIQKNLSRLKLEGKAKTDQIWIHSIVVSVCANELGRVLVRDQEMDWGTLGLLHDIGKYFLYSLKKRSEPDPGLPSLLREEGLFGVNHAVLGGLVAESWGLPEDIWRIIGFHHHPAFFGPEAIPSHLRLGTSVVYLADHVAKILGFSDGDDEIYRLKTGFLEQLNLGPDIKSLMTPAFVHAIERAISINEEEGFFPGIREVKGKEIDSRKMGAEPEEDFLKVECPKCDYDTAISPELLSFGEKFMWVCPNCNTRIVKRFDRGPHKND